MTRDPVLPSWSCLARLPTTCPKLSVSGARLWCHRSPDRFEQRSLARRDGRARGVDARFGAGVEGFTARQDGLELSHRGLVVGHRAKIALVAHPAHMLGRGRRDPDGEEGRQEELEGHWFRDDAASGREYHRTLARDHLLECRELEAPIALLPVEREDLGDREARLGLDCLVELDEGPAEPLGREAPERRFACTPQADQRDAIA